MTEIILIKTSNSKEVKEMLEKSHIAYEIYQGENSKKISDKELENAYREAYSDPERLKLTQQWQKAALKDLNKRSKNEWKNI